MHICESEFIKMQVKDIIKTELHMCVRGVSPVFLLSWLGVLCVGLLTREPMIGDEVTHYYLAVAQSRDLSNLTMTAEIPKQDGFMDVRTYPHVILWHYLAAIVLRLSGGSFVAVQILQSLFWLQMLIYSWLLFRSENSEESGVLVYVTILASLPACLIFGVTFYQDVPAIAQMMASFYYLRQRRLAWSVVFLLLALSIKETMFVMIPAYFGVMLFVYPWREFRRKVLVLVGSVGFLFLIFFVGTTCLFNSLHQEYYPYKTIRSAIQKLGIDVRAIEDRLIGHEKAEERKAREKKAVEARLVLLKRDNPEILLSDILTKQTRQQIANNPGDVRSPVNLLIYGGALFWVVLCIGTVMLFRGASDGGRQKKWNFIWMGCGLWYVVVTALIVRSAPDARFFLPGVPLVLIGMAGPVSWLPGRRVWLPVLMFLALMQTAVVLGKTYQLRHVKSGVIGAIEFLRQNPPIPNKVFMYPEGSYRLFPCSHEWYMGINRLRDFWRGNNDERIQTLQKNKVGAIVIKKWLVAPIDKNMNNLGIYPDFFVKQIAEDQRFVRTYENQEIMIYSVPPLQQAETNNCFNVK